MRTSLGVCTHKKRYPTALDAQIAGRDAPFQLNPYRCDLCQQYHLTSRTKGMFVARSPIAGNDDKAAR